jgi:hypothetical protein
VNLVLVLHKQNILNLEHLLDLQSNVHSDIIADVSSQLRADVQSVPS